MTSRPSKGTGNPQGSSNNSRPGGSKNRPNRAVGSSGAKATGSKTPGGGKQMVPKIDPNAFPIEKRRLPNGEIEYAPKGKRRQIKSACSNLSVFLECVENHFGQNKKSRIFF